jgi:hypothetical protein
VTESKTYQQDVCRSQAALSVPALAASVLETAGECATPGTPDGQFFPNVSKIAYEGPDSTNPLAFHYYNAEEVIMGKPMKEWCARELTAKSN